jgi:hypothetical protein
VLCFKIDAAIHLAASREGKMVVDGPMVLVVAFGWLAFIWIIVIYGSGFFGPKS